MEYPLDDTGDFPGSSHRPKVFAPAILVLAVCACLLIIPAAAHAPTDMKISFDPGTAKIYVTITHPVDDPATHYLSRVQVKLNGDVISDPDYKSQPTKDTFTLTYDVNANPGDEIWVTATCVRGGTLEKSYTVPQPVRPTLKAPSGTAVTPAAARLPASVPPTMKAPLGLLPLFGAMVSVFLTRKI
jgi:hypothetical protein